MPELHATLTDTVSASPGAAQGRPARSPSGGGVSETRAPFARWTAAHYGVPIDAPQLGEALEPLYEEYQTGRPRARRRKPGRSPWPGRHHPRRRRALEGSRPRARAARRAPLARRRALAAPGPARRSRPRAVDAGAAGGPGRRLPPPRGEHLRGRRGRRLPGLRLHRHGGSRVQPLLVSVPRSAQGRRVTLSHAYPHSSCVTCYAQIVSSRRWRRGGATPADDERGPAVCTKGIIMQRKPSYLDRAQPYTQRKIFVALLAPRQLR